MTRRGPSREQAAPIIRAIIGQTIVGIEAEADVEWDGHLLTTLYDLTFVLSNGVRLRSLGEPIAVENLPDEGESGERE